MTKLVLDYEELKKEFRKNKFYPNGEGFSDGWNKGISAALSIVKDLGVKTK